jgi:hypothetical protein
MTPSAGTNVGMTKPSKSAQKEEVLGFLLRSSLSALMTSFRPPPGSDSTADITSVFQ